MLEIEDFSDERHKSWCIHCGAAIADAHSNRDHVPTKSFLTKELRVRGTEYDKGSGDDYDYLPQVIVCRRCNSSFSEDENYLLCVLHAVKAGSLYPDPARYPEAASILQSNRHNVRLLKPGPDGQLPLFDNLEPFTLYPDVERVSRVIIKNARGHAYHEIGEPVFLKPSHVAFVPLQRMTSAQREAFERSGTGAELAVWPEVGSRMMVALANETVTVGGWVTVESGRYRYAVEWTGGITVKTVIWEYLATETRWDP